MVSGIRPHFLFNTLGIIEYYCQEAPEKASRLVHDFTMFLRGDLQGMVSDAPILLSQEIEHVRHYAAIEKVRYPDLRFEFSLGCEDFFLPPLSVQPLVENAVKHGLLAREKGGTVTVSSYETERFRCVSVADDGVGFDPAGLGSGGKHNTIRGVRQRVEAMCGGTLTLDSHPGLGTTARIEVPKEAGYDCNGSRR